MLGQWASHVGKKLNLPLSFTSYVKKKKSSWLVDLNTKKYRKVWDREVFRSNNNAGNDKR